jgi:hypothetical protein
MTTTRFVISQKSAVIIYISAEACIRMVSWSSKHKENLPLCIFLNG